MHCSRGLNKVQALHQGLGNLSYALLVHVPNAVQYIVPR